MATGNEKIAEGFPALKKLGFATGTRAVPFVQQLEWTWMWRPVLGST